MVKFSLLNWVDFPSLPNLYFMCIIQLQYSYNPSFLSLPAWQKGLTHQSLQDKGLLNRHLWNPDQMRLIVPSPKKFVYVGDRCGLELAKNSHMISRLIFSGDCVKIPQHLLLISLTKFEKNIMGERDQDVPIFKVVLFLVLVGLFGVI